MYKWDLSVSVHEDYDHIRNMGALLDETMRLCSSNSNPIIVHSSVRTGDTGVFIANWKLKSDLQNTKWAWLSLKAILEDKIIFVFRKHYIDVKTTVKEMLKQKMGLIQTPHQYLNIYKFLQNERFNKVKWLQLKMGFLEFTRYSENTRSSWMVQGSLLSSNEQKSFQALCKTFYFQPWFIAFWISIDVLKLLINLLCGNNNCS